MTPEQLKELRKAAEEATPGPWIGCGPSFGDYMPAYLNEVVVDRQGEEDDCYEVCRSPAGLDKESSCDMAYIAAANPATILQLLDYVESLERDAARYRYLRDDGEGFDISVLERDTEDGELWVHGYPPEELDDAIDAVTGESK